MEDLLDWTLLRAAQHELRLGVPDITPPSPNPEEDAQACVEALGRWRSEEFERVCEETPGFELLPEEELLAFMKSRGDGGA